MPSRKEQFERKVRVLLRDVRKLNPQARAQVLEMLDAAKKRVLGELATTAPGSFQQAQLQALKRSIEEAFEFFRRDATAAVQRLQEKSWEAGIETVDGPIRTAGLPAPALGGISRTTLGIAQGYTADLISGLSRKAAADVNAAIQRAFLGGQSVQDIIQQIAKGLGAKGTVSLWDPLGERATVIAINEIQRIHSIAAQARMEELHERMPEMKKQWAWVNAGQAPRATHRDYSGTVVEVNEPFEVAARYGLPTEELMYPRDPNGTPANTINCLLPGAVVEGKVLRGLKTRYSGPAVQIETVKGNLLRVTGNHPVLTVRGWVPAKDIQEADHLVCHRSIQTKLVFPDDNEEHPPARIEDVFHSLGPECHRLRITNSLEFHGDAPFTDGEVEIVNSYRKLLFKSDAELRKDERQLALVGANSSLPKPHRHSAPFLSLDRIASPTASGPGIRHRGSDKGGVPLHSDPSCCLRLGAASRLDTVALEKSSECCPAHMQFLGELVNAGAGAILFAQVARISRFEWAGHVFDAETETGWIVATGIFVSNCHCQTRPYFAADALKPTARHEQILKDLGIEISVTRAAA